MLGHKISLKFFNESTLGIVICLHPYKKKEESILGIFSDHRTIKLEVNNKKTLKTIQTHANESIFEQAMNQWKKA
jgi:hypothetical protein